MFTVSTGARHASYVMTIEETKRSQRPYRYGLILLCCGALINWLGLTENYGLSIRYLGVSCIICGAILICSAMCCWLNTSQNGTTEGDNDNENAIHVIAVHSPNSPIEKPPSYETVTIEPPSYDDAIKLNPSLLIPRPTEELQQVGCSQIQEGCSQIQEASSSLTIVKSEEPHSQSTLR